MDEAEIEQLLDEFGAFDDSDVDEVVESDHNTDSEQSDNENEVEYDPVPPGIGILPDLRNAQEMESASDTAEPSQQEIEADLDDLPPAFRIYYLIHLMLKRWRLMQQNLVNKGYINNNHVS